MWLQEGFPQSQMKSWVHSIARITSCLHSNDSLLKPACTRAQGMQSAEGAGNRSERPSSALHLRACLPRDVMMHCKVGTQPYIQAYQEFENSGKLCDALAVTEAMLAIVSRRQQASFQHNFD